MAWLKRVGSVVGLGVLGLGVAMAVTNPGPNRYNEFAAQRLAEYLKTNACPQAPAVLGGILAAQCVTLVDNNRPQLQQFIAANTQRQNFLLFSLYKTNLSLDGLESIIPSYYFESVGLFQNFVTYKAERRP